MAWTYIWIFRAIPTLIQLLIVWNALPQLIPALKGQWFSPFLAATIALSLNEAAYAAEIMRGGLLAVDDGQRHAARALGMPPFKVFTKVVAPQLIQGHDSAHGQRLHHPAQDHQPGQHRLLCAN